MVCRIRRKSKGYDILQIHNASTFICDETEKYEPLVYVATYSVLHYLRFPSPPPPSPFLSSLVSLSKPLSSQQNVVCFLLVATVQELFGALIFVCTVDWMLHQV